MFILQIVLYRLLLDFSYFVFVHPIYSYNGFALEINVYAYIISWIAIATLLPLMNTSAKAISDYAILFTYLLVIVPLSSLYGLDFSRPIQPLAISIFALILIIFIVRIKFPNFRQLPRIKDGYKYAVVLSLICVFFVAINYRLSGVELNLDFEKVYDYRNSNALLASGGILSYINSWTYKVFNITLISLCLLHRRFFLLVIFLAIQIFFYAATAHKLVLFLPIFCLTCWFYFKRSNSLIFLPFLLNLLIMLILLLVVVYDLTIAGAVFIRRLFFIPAHLSYVYYEFFSVNPYFFWSDSVLSWLFKNQYNFNIAHTIGDYLGRYEMGANNGFISSGYANAGILGVLIYSFILALILRFANFLTINKLPIWLSLSILAVPLSNTILNSDLFTTMLTHGFGVALLMIYLLSSTSKK